MTCRFFPLHFGRWSPDRRSMIGRCPTGRRRMRKSGEESADHPANFNCELNLPDHRRMSPGWVPNRRMAARFLQDSSHAVIRRSILPNCDVAINNANLFAHIYSNFMCSISSFFVVHSYGVLSLCVLCVQEYCTATNPTICTPPPTLLPTHLPAYSYRLTDSHTHPPTDCIPVTHSHTLTQTD